MTNLDPQELLKSKHKLDEQKGSSQILLEVLPAMVK